jgi:hypothetical protein
MDGLFRFLAGSSGRIVRAAAGLALIVVGLIWVHGVVGWVLAVVGLVPLLAGVLDFCVFAPLFGLPFVGGDLRRALTESTRD